MGRSFPFAGRTASRAAPRSRSGRLGEERSAPRRAPGGSGGGLGAGSAGGMRGGCGGLGKAPPAQGRGLLLYVFPAERADSELHGYSLMRLSLAAWS